MKSLGKQNVVFHSFVNGNQVGTPQVENRVVYVTKSGLYMINWLDGKKEVRKVGNGFEVRLNAYSVGIRRASNILGN